MGSSLRNKQRAPTTIDTLEPPLDRPHGENQGLIESFDLHKSLRIATRVQTAEHLIQQSYSLIHLNDVIGIGILNRNHEDPILDVRVDRKGKGKASERLRRLLLSKDCRARLDKDSKSWRQAICIRQRSPQEHQCQPGERQGIIHRHLGLTKGDSVPPVSSLCLPWPESNARLERVGSFSFFCDACRTLVHQTAGPCRKTREWLSWCSQWATSHSDRRNHERYAQVDVYCKPQSPHLNVPKVIYALLSSGPQLAH